MLIQRLQKFFRVYRSKQLPPIAKNKHYFGILLTALGWLCIWFTHQKMIPERLSLNYSNYCFYQHLIAFMALGLWAGLKGKMCFFSKNPGGIVVNSLCVVACFILFFSLKLSANGTTLFIEGSYHTNLDSVFVALIALLFLKQKVPKTLWLGLAFILLGTTIIQNLNLKLLLQVLPLHILITVLYCFFLSILIISTNYLIRNGNPPIVICLYNTLLSFLCFGLLSIPGGIFLPSAYEFFLICGSGLLYAIAIVLFTSAHYYTPFYYIMPIHSVVNIYSLVFTSFLDQKIPSNGSLVGIGLLLLGFAFLTRQRASKRQHSLVTSNMVDTAA